MTNTRDTIPQFAKNSSHNRSWVRSVALEMALENRAIGRRIAQLRDQARLTQPAAAERVGVSLRGYQKWEAGTRPGWDNLEKLADVFSVKVEDIIGQPASSNGDQPDVQARLDRIDEKLDVLSQRLEALEQAVTASAEQPPPPPLPEGLAERLDDLERLLKAQARDRRVG